MQRYDHQKIEKKWQEKWNEENLYEVPDTKKGSENFYTLVEFSYPSGNLHVGHWYAYAPMDIYTRYMRMQGKNVMFPMGFDSFGLPAENAAIKHKQNPRKWTYENIEKMRTQLHSMGASFDWSREVVTSNPDYYKWTQWLFTKLFEKGLAHQAETVVSWCPSCKTVLANEQVKVGRCERCDTEVEKRRMRQWLLKITDYADRLLEDLKNLDWPEPIKEAQRQWIGKNEGAEIDFEIQNTKYKIPVFTTRPDTLFGATYLVLAPEHESVANLKSKVENWDEVEKYIKQAGKKTELERQENREKTGIELKGVKAINPGSKEEIPVWVADYVLASVGTGAIMAVPAHDERDYEFAFTNMKEDWSRVMKHVVDPASIEDIKGNMHPSFTATILNGETGIQASERSWQQDFDLVRAGKYCYMGEGILINSGKFDGLSSEEAIEKITKAVGGKISTTYRLRDWGVSRQRYWGCPIPLVFCEHCAEKAESGKLKVESEGEKLSPGWFAVPEKELPVELPEIKDYIPSGDGKSPLNRVDSFLNAKCPKCGKDAKRETDTLDTFVDSSWYFLRYTDPKNNKEFADRKKMDVWMPVDFYSGGAEHTTMHLLYSRFFQKALFDIGLVADSEPYKVRMNRGLIMGPDGQKMSKRWGNVVDPDDVVSELGADTVRTYLAFIGPYNEVGQYPWSPESITGVRRFLDRVWRLSSKLESKASKLVEAELHRTVKKVGDEIASLKMNTAVAALMSFLNVAEKEGVTQEQFEVFLKLLSPMAPHISEEIWREEMRKGSSIHLERWPAHDEGLLADDKMTIVVQVDGRTRGRIEIARGTSEDEVISQAKRSVERWLNKAIKKEIYVPDKLVNVVLD